MTPRRAESFLNLNEPVIKVAMVDYGEVDSGQETAATETIEQIIERYIFRRQKTINFFVKSITAMKWGMIYGRAIGEISPIFFYNLPRTFESKLPRFIAVNPKRYTCDKVEDSDFVLDEVKREETEIHSFVQLEQKILRMIGNDGASFQKEEYQNLKETVNEALEAKREKGESLKISIDYWWGYLFDDEAKRYVMYLAVFVSGKDLRNPERDSEGKFMPVLKTDPLGNNCSPFVRALFRFDPGSLEGVGVPEILKQPQDELNALRSARMALINRIAFFQSAVRINALQNPQELLRFKRRGLVKIKTAEDVRNVIFPLLPAGITSAISGIIQAESSVERDIEAGTAVNDQVRGVGGVNATPVTAAEANIKFGETTLRLTGDFKMFAEEYLAKCSKILFEQDRAIFKKIIMGTDVRAKTELKMFLERYIGKNNVEKFVNFIVSEADIEAIVVGVDPGGKWQSVAAQRIVQALQMIEPLEKGLNLKGLTLNAKAIAEVVFGKLDIGTSEPLIIPYPRPPQEQQPPGMPQGMPPGMGGNGASMPGFPPGGFQGQPMEEEVYG